MKIVVMAGGLSPERGVSIVSGKMVCQALRSKGEEAVLLDAYFGSSRLTAEKAFPADFDVEAEAAWMEEQTEKLPADKRSRDFFGPDVVEICRKADIVFLALHGEDGENGKVQAAFDLMRIPYTGAGHLSSAIAMDKGLAKIFLEASGIPVPNGISIRYGIDSRDLKDYGMNLPVVVKPCSGGSSVGVHIVHDQGAYEEALEEAFAYEKELIVEDFICGREFSIGVIDGKALPIIEIAPVEGFYDYKNKYTSGAAVETCPALISEEKTREMQKYAEKAMEALQIESYARFDFLMNEKEEIYCLEGNTLPGMTPTSLMPQEAAAMGIDFGDLCRWLIRSSLDKYQ